MTEKYTLYIGLNDKDSKVQKISTVEAVKVVTNLCTTFTDGATIFEADGVYKHDDGSIVVEKTLRVELLFIDKQSVRQIVNTVKQILNQESVAVQHEIVDSELW